jgi:hypothetical protein
VSRGRGGRVGGPARFRRELGVSGVDRATSRSSAAMVGAAPAVGQHAAGLRADRAVGCGRSTSRSTWRPTRWTWPACSGQRSRPRGCGSQSTVRPSASRSTWIPRCGSRSSFNLLSKALEFKPGPGANASRSTSRNAKAPMLRDPMGPGAASPIRWHLTGSKMNSEAGAAA